MQYLIEFKGQKFAFIGDLESDGALTHPSDYESGRGSFAHLYETGEVKRFGEVIGHKADIKVLAEIELNPKFDDVLQNFGQHPSWFGPEA